MAAIVGGLLMYAAERRDRRREPTDDDVLHAAALYREYYGAEAHRVIGDHMLAASFAPDGRHKRFLKRVSTELLSKISVIEIELEKKQIDGAQKDLLGPKNIRCDL
ncbi:hypothetical protein [Mesorhizobium sp. NBSH29]|uniref:hypothetical protein n=1 Tax=Mesorhizobium sp. NBSH29 TaxID=2654249 RepID=UPI00215633AF|nr:hypothetical protein [Mesorhizobium sp. NBSH29]